MIYSYFRDLKISKVGLGAVQFGMDYGFTKAKTQSEVDAILTKCVECGINFIDTARGYGDSEAKIGLFLKRQERDRFIIATKLQKISDLNSDPRAHVKCSIEASLEHLKTGRIDILQLHETPERLLINPLFWEGIAEAKKAGRIVYFGVSVYTPAETMALIEKYGDHIDFIQAPYSVFDQEFETVFPLCEKRGIGVISRSVFLKGLIPAALNEIPPELDRIKKFKQLLSLLARRVGLEDTELALLFVIASKAIHSTLVGANAVDEVSMNVKVLDKLQLVPALRKELKELQIAEPFLRDPRQWSQL